MISYRAVSVVVILGLSVGCDRSRQRDISGEVKSTSALDSATRMQWSDSLFVLAERTRAGGEPDSALSLHLRAIGLREGITLDPRLFYSQWKTALTYADLSQWETANQYLEKARFLAMGLSLPADTLIRLYLSSATVQREVRDLTSSVSLTQYATKIALNRKPRDSAMLVDCYSRLGNAYNVDKKFDQAVRAYNQALEFANPNRPSEALATLYRSISVLYLFAGDPERQREYLRKAMTAYHRVTERRSPRIYSGLLLSLGDLYQRTGNNDSALHYLHLALAERRLLNDRADLSGALNTLSVYWQSRSRLDSAIWYIQACLVHEAGDSLNYHWRFNPAPRKAEINMNLILDLFQKSDLLQQWYASDTTQTQRLKIALSTFLMADSLVTELRRSLRFDDPQLAAMSENPVAYTRGLDQTTILFRRTGEVQYFDAAFRLMEQSRAAVLKNAVERAESYGASGLPDRYRQRENRILEERSKIVLSLADHRLVERVRDSLNALLVRNDAEYTRLQEQVEKDRPGYFLVRYSSEWPSARRIQDLMRQENATWIEFLWGDSAVFRLAISSRGLNLDRIEVDDEMREALRVVTRQVAGLQDDYYKKSRFTEFVHGSNSLYNILLRDLLAETRGGRLIISADGPLGSFPFEALVTEPFASEEPDYHLPYLVLGHEVSYHYSSRYYERQWDEDRHGDKVLAMGYGGEELPWTREELKLIQAAMKNSNNTFYIDSLSTESVFKEHIEDFNIVHLAIHGEADTANALQSKLIFRTPDGEEEDGELFAYELYSLPMVDLDLAVLSACESGLGKAQEGEGMMSMARGFVYAGCPSLVMSLWKIPDKSSMAVMANFYKRLARHEPIHLALAGAKRDYLQSVKGLTSHPVYWAAFVAVGDTKAVVPRTYEWTLPIVLTVLVLAATFVTYRNRRNLATRVPLGQITQVHNATNSWFCYGFVPK